MAIKNFKSSNIVYLVVALLIIGLLFIPPRKQGKQPKATAPVEVANKVPVLLVDRYKALNKALDIARVKADLSTIASHPSRMVGYPGCEKAAEFVEGRFRELGVKDVHSEEFKVTVPIDEGSSLEVAGRKFAIHSLWPNLVRTSHLPPGGMTVHLIDAIGGRLPDFDGKVVKESAALVDFNSGTEWLNAPRLGARALLFVEPETTIRGEGEAKFSAIPVSMPRFWISRKDAAVVKQLIAQGNAREAVIRSEMPWKKVTARNIVGVIPGSDPKLKDQWIVLHASYDGTSVVPSLAPGAENACGIAGLLELARIFNQPEFAPKRSVMLIATGAHFQGLAGMRYFMERHIDDYRKVGGIDRIHSWMNRNYPAGHDAGATTWLVPIGVMVVCFLLIVWVWRMLRALRQKHGWLIAVPVVLVLLTLAWGVSINSMFARGFDFDTPSPRKFYLWAGLDLSSQTKGVGIFYKGYFYDYREDIQGKFSDLASRARENSERVASVFGFYDQRAARFADGVNPISGKNWRNFIPGKIALDTEVVTLAGGKGVSLVSVDDGRQLVETPFDTIDKINFDNLRDQLAMIVCITDHWFRDISSVSDEQKAPVKVVDSRTVRVDDPMSIGYVQGVYTNPRGKGENYFKPKTEKELPDSLATGVVRLKSALPSDCRPAYLVHKPVSKLGVNEECQFTRMGLQGGFSRLSGKVVMYDPRKSFVPNLKVGDCLAVVRSSHKSFMGVRANIVDKTTRKAGYFLIPGVAPVTAYGWQKPTSIGAYKLDPVKGDIVAAPDQGSYGEFYPTEFPITTGAKDMPVIVFDCKATSIYDLIDPQGLRALPILNIYDGDTNGPPRQFGVAVAVPEPMNPHVEDMAVIFTEDTAKSKMLAIGVGSKELRRVRIKLVMSAGPAAKRLLLLNATKDKPEGHGYDFTEGGTLDETAYKVANDMWTLDESRLASLESKGIKNDGLRGLHNTTRRFLDLAGKAKNSLNYSVFDSYCRAAWGYEARAYPDVTNTAQDVVNGVVFYLFLMLPFAFFCERLFFARADLWKQIREFFIIFLGIFYIFKIVHPAFQIAGYALIVLIAFVMLALSGLVISIVSSKFEEQLKQFNRSVSGIHKADIGRMSVAAAAFSLGISNMRRRKARTVLTCITLILLTFTVLSFTSIVSELKFNKVPAKRDADTHLYNGLLIRTAMWDPLQEVAYRVLKDEYGNEGKRGKVYPVAPRSWYFGTSMGEQSFLTLRRGGDAYDAKAAVGMVPDEAEIMDFNTKNRKVFIAGDWFGYKNGKRVAGKVDPYSMIIPSAVADKLKITPDQVGKVKVEFGGVKYTVVAIVRNDLFKRVKDLDNEPLTPVDFILMSKMSQQQQQSMGETGFREYIHLEPDSVFFVPYDTLISMGGDVRSIAIKFAGVEEVQQQLNSLMPRLGLNLYAGVGESIYRYSSIAGSSSKGFTNVFVPVLIAALIVLNTMLGSVFERVREIGIFSSIGLAPNHIAVLFIAESMVYANLGAVAGYVVGQSVSKILSVTNALPGLYLNFSSMSAVTSTLIVVAVVLLSTLYPARKASEVATPAVERSWRVPDPVGDDWDITLPFAVTGEQAVGVNGFLKEWFQAYEEYSIGDFVTQDVDSGECETEFGKCYTISCKAWLAPFDLGVSQSVTLRTEPTSMEDVFEVKLRITRESGDISNWKRVNRRFLNTLRKQFLIWRTLKVSEREKYLRGVLDESGSAEPAAV